MDDINELLPGDTLSADEMRRLYFHTYEDACQQQGDYEADHPESIGGPLFDWQAAQDLKDLYESYKSGDKSAILAALHICFRNGFPVPQWCIKGFLFAFGMVHHHYVQNWDDVFGPVHPKGTHLGALAWDRDKSYLAYRRIIEIKKTEPDASICNALFERVGREMAIGGKTLIESYYYKWKRILE